MNSYTQPRRLGRPRIPTRFQKKVMGFSLTPELAERIRIECSEEKYISEWMERTLRKVLKLRPLE